MPIYKKTEGIVLSSDDISENDKGFTIYTKDYGKLFVIARGGRKISSKLASHLQPFSVTEVMYAQGKSVNYVTESIMQEDFRFIKQSLSDIALGSHCLEIVDALTKEDHREPEVYDLLKELLSALNDQESHDKTKNYKTKEILITKLFSLKFLQILGYQPRLDSCVECGCDIESFHIYFDPQTGVLCQQHGIENQENINISANALKILRLALKLSLSDMMKISCKRDLVLEINNIINLYLSVYLDTDLRSEVWLSGLLQK